MFRIIGDEIEYLHQPFAHIVASPYSTLRDCAEGEIWLCDAAKREAEEQKWRDEIEAAHAEEINELEMKISDLDDEKTRLEMKISDLDDEKTRLEKMLAAIDGGASALELIAEAKVNELKWREIAEANRKAYLEAIKPKPRKRRVR